MASSRILIFGTGGVGSIYAYILSKSRASVTAICRSNYDAVKAKGITISSKVFGEVSVRPSVVRTVAEAATERKPWDFILVCSKAFPGTASLLKEAVSPSTAIILAQNGIGIEEDYAKAYPDNTIISGVVYLPTTQVSPGVITMGSIERLELGTYPANAPPAAKQRVVDFAELFTSAGATADVYDDIQAMRWSKLAVNASWNPICALTGCTDADFLRSSDPGATNLVRQVMREIVTLAQASGYGKQINEETVEYQLGRAQARLEGGAVEPSMLTDVKYDRPLEVEAILGNAIEIARRLNVNTPSLDMLCTLTRGLNASIIRGK